MTRLRLARTVWLDRLARPRQRRFPALRRSTTAEVVIVGGGITGAAAAWLFASAGVRVALLERALVGQGSTIASTALLMQEPDRDFHELAARYGATRAARIWRLGAAATRQFIRTIRDLEIPCDLETLDSVYYAPRQEEVPKLEREYRQRQYHGLAGRWLDARGVARATGIDGAAAIRTSGNGQVDPHRACIGFLRAAAAKGARIFERSPVTRMVAGRSGVDVITQRGAVSADTVVIATGYATPELEPLAARFRLMHTYVVATAPLAAAIRRTIGLGQVMVWDTDRPYHYARWTRDHRLILGGADRPQVHGRLRAKALAAGIAAVRQHFTRLYPSLDAIALEYGWEGLFATTPDSLPYIGTHRRYPRHLFALGYGGNGMTFGFLAAQLLLGIYSGTTSGDHELFAFNRTRNARRSTPEEIVRNSSGLSR